MTVGIQALGFYGGSACVDVIELAQYRKRDMARFENLLMKQKSIALPYEDPVSFGVNAARRIVDALPQEEKDRIELLITCSESGIDFGKSMSTYIHHYLDLDRNCRLFEIKQACYSGTAGLQMAVNFILSGVSPGARALVVATDLARFMVDENGEGLTMDWAFFEPSGGAGAVALLVSDRPDIFAVDVGANGYYSYEVMDTCRPIPDSEAGNADLSLLSYLDCCDGAYIEYLKRVPSADYRRSFDYLCFHTPFGGMVKGAHRNMMRKHSDAKRDEIEADFQARAQPGLAYCQRVGNIMGATSLLSLIGAIDHGDFAAPRRIGCFSYGSGCSSEFYSGVVTAGGQRRVRDMEIGAHLDARHRLDMADYETLLAAGATLRFGTRNAVMNMGLLPKVWETFERRPGAEKRLFLAEINEFHRRYEWVG
ncbi:MAG: hydroxymethylglutaryl-CoA synthase family protein [Alphaproteobacteria bacterium]|nr:hydroxymethylglutaryl-CoA synthase family protein [Alphaproteobacteria bacterium]MBM3652040.1 hydroxymethylglutaryl-CoA synthase family protein [Alphaproteobacteria bacterium]